MLRQRPVACIARACWKETNRTGLLASNWQTTSLLQNSTKLSYHSSHLLRPSPATARIGQLTWKQSRRTISGKPLPEKKHWIINFCYRSAAWFGGSVVFIGVGVGAFFLYDASTYREDLSFRDIQVSEIALSPRRGGPKNLPIAEVQIDDDDCAEMQRQKHKPKLVVLGGGWGSVALLKTLNPEEYHVTLVSPTNYFLFTPMLPSATVGTLEFRSLVEPIRRIVARVRGHFIRARAENIEFSEKLVELSQKDNEGNEVRFYLPYDKLVIGVGSTTNPHGVEGLENCNFLKDIDDAQKIKNKILTNMEYACLPTTSDDERRRLLSFVVSGGGPTGVEFAAELFDLLNEDLTAHFPKILRNEISVHLIQSRGHILNTYDEALSKYAEARFARDQVEILTNSRVKAVEKDKIIFTQKGPGGETITKELPMGFCLWSTGVSQTEFCQRVSEALGSTQTNRHALETDSHLRLNGTPLGDVYAIGDCATVQNNVADHLVTFLRTLAWEKGLDPEKMQITFGEWREVAHKVRKRFPQAADHLKRLDKLFAQYDKDQSGTLDFGELRELLMQIDSKLTSLPATAQRAHQQGQYLGHKFNKLARAAPGLTLNDVRDGDLDEAVYKAFEYHHLGSLAYIGNSAVFDLGGGWSLTGGLWAVYAWRSVYFAQSVSLRTRILLAMDWSKRALFGRGEHLSLVT
jgi:NADH dehydrogenase